MEINTILNTTIITFDFQTEQINITQEENVDWVNTIINLVDDENF